MKVPTVCCRTNGEVERVARRVVKASDRVIEIGSALGSLTAALRDLVGGDDGRGGRVFAFDVRRKLAVAGGGARTAKYRSTTEMTGVETLQNCSVDNVVHSASQRPTNNPQQTPDSNR